VAISVAQTAGNVADALEQDCAQLVTLFRGGGHLANQSVAVTAANDIVQNL